MNTLSRALLLVGCISRNMELLADCLKKECYSTMIAKNYEEFDKMLSQQEVLLSGCLIDITGFDEQIWTRCERLRAGKIPFLIFSSKQSAEIQQASLSHGARGVMVKPLIVKKLTAVVQSIVEA